LKFENGKSSLKFLMTNLKFENGKEEFLKFENEK